MTLADYLKDHLLTPFEWGKHDCVLFAAGWVKAATGRDYAAGVGTWSSARQAMAAVKAAGGLEAVIDARLPRIQPNYAKDGDIALQAGIVMIFSGAHIVGPGKAGLVFISRGKAKCAWAVGNG